MDNGTADAGRRGRSAADTDTRSDANSHARPGALQTWTSTCKTFDAASEGFKGLRSARGWGSLPPPGQTALGKGGMRPKTAASRLIKPKFLNVPGAALGLVSPRVEQLASLAAFQAAKVRGVRMVLLATNLLLVSLAMHVYMHTRPHTHTTARAHTHIHTHTRTHTHTHARTHTHGRTLAHTRWHPRWYWRTEHAHVRIAAASRIAAVHLLGRLEGGQLLLLALALAALVRRLVDTAITRTCDNRITTGLTLWHAVSATNS